MSSINKNKIIEINQNQRSTDLIQPLAKPKQTQQNYGLMLQTNSDEKLNYRPLQKSVVKKIANSRKEDRIPRPGQDINQIWNIYKNFTTNSPDYGSNNWINILYARPYYFEGEYFEKARQENGRNYLKNISVVCPAVSDVNEIDETLVLEEMKKHWMDCFGNEKRMIEFPQLFPHFTEEKRKAKMFEAGRPFRSKIVQWYLRNNQ